MFIIFIIILIIIIIIILGVFGYHIGLHLFDINDKINNNHNLNENNLITFNNNLNKYFQFRNNSNIINEPLYKKINNSNPNLILPNEVIASSGLTIKTNMDINKDVKICDDNLKCINLNIKNGVFNLYPFNSNITNFNILNNDKTKVLANFDFSNNAIYLGSNGEQAGMFIKDDKIYIKNLYLMNDNATYQNPYNTIKFDSNNIINNINSIRTEITSNQNIPKIANITYFIKKENNLISIELSINSKFNIPIMNLFFNIPQLKNISLNKIIYNKNKSSKIPMINITYQNVTLSYNTILEPNINHDFYNDEIPLSTIDLLENFNYIHNKISVEF